VNFGPPRKNNNAKEAPKLSVAPWAILLDQMLPVFMRNHPKMIERRMMLTGKTTRPTPMFSWCPYPRRIIASGDDRREGRSLREKTDLQVAPPSELLTRGNER
jgi:hypothetical protein